jgi:hypothetical protein
VKHPWRREGPIRRDRRDTGGNTRALAALSGDIFGTTHTCEAGRNEEHGTEQKSLAHRFLSQISPTRLARANGNPSYFVILALVKARSFLEPMRLVSPPRFNETRMSKLRILSRGSWTSVGVAFLSWDHPFHQPVLLPNGLSARTLREAAEYGRRLPTAVRYRNQWRLAIHTLIEAAEDQGPVLFARVAMIRAVEHAEVCVSGVDRRCRRLPRDR